MIGKLNHLAIAVPDIAQASVFYRDVLGAEISDPVPQPEHGVTVVFVQLSNTKIELLEPLGENSPVQGLLNKNPQGGIHHICLETGDIQNARNRLHEHSIRILGETKIGAHDLPVMFLHPKDCFGTLIELEEARK